MHRKKGGYASPDGLVERLCTGKKSFQQSICPFVHPFYRWTDIKSWHFHDLLGPWRPLGKWTGMGRITHKPFPPGFSKFVEPTIFATAEATSTTLMIVLVISGSIATIGDTTYTPTLTTIGLKGVRLNETGVLIMYIKREDNLINLLFWYVLC